jgi:hypothetical protein
MAPPTGAFLYTRFLFMEESAHPSAEFAPQPFEEPIRAELFGVERLEQHAESLAAAQQFFETVSLVDEVLRVGTTCAAMDFSTATATGTRY